MAKLSTTLKNLVDKNGKALVAYIVAGDPEPGVTVKLMHALVHSGADVIELGVPFSDPEAEGPVIQLAHERALVHNISLVDCLAMVRQFRESNSETPVVLMGYLNPIEVMGYDVFAEKASAAGVNGTIIVNLPPEEAGDYANRLEDKGIETVYLLAPTTTDDRARTVCDASRGFVYYVSLKGTTGAGHLDAADVAEKVGRFRQYSHLPILVGFGVRDGNSASAVAEVSDGAVVGSAIVNLMAENQGNEAALIASVSEFVAGLRRAIDDR